MGTQVDIPTIEEFRRVIREELARAQAQDRLFTAQEAAEYLNVNVRTIWAWRKDGKLPFAEISPGSYRFKESDLKAFLAERSRKEPSPSEYAANMARRKRPTRKKKSAGQNRRRSRKKLISTPHDKSPQKPEGKKDSNPHVKLHGENGEAGNPIVARDVSPESATSELSAEKQLANTNNR